MIYIFKKDAKQKEINKRWANARRTNNDEDWQKVPIAWYNPKKHKIYIIEIDDGIFCTETTVAHEFIHKVLHEQINEKACEKWDSDWIFDRLWWVE